MLLMSQPKRVFGSLLLVAAAVVSPGISQGAQSMGYSTPQCDDEKRPKADPQCDDEKKPKADPQCDDDKKPKS
jgi:hypothetical protein